MICANSSHTCVHAHTHTTHTHTHTHATHAHTHATHAHTHTHTHTHTVTVCVKHVTGREPVGHTLAETLSVTGFVWANHGGGVSRRKDLRGRSHIREKIQSPEAVTCET